MKFFKPNVQLFSETKTVGIESEVKHYLYVVTYFNNSDYVFHNYESTEIKSEGNSINVQLNFKRDINLPSLKVIKPISTVITFKEWPFGKDEEGEVNVSVNIDKDNGTARSTDDDGGTGSKKGQTVTSTKDMDQNDRPYPAKTK